MKTPLTVKLKNYFPPKEGQYGWSQGAYIITDKGEFKCYNSGPVWFGPTNKGQDIDVMGEWKQNKQTNDWYLQCAFGQDVQQGPPVPSGASKAPPTLPQTTQGPTGPQGPSKSSNGKDELIIRRVVAKIVGRLIEAKVLVYSKRVFSEAGNDIVYWIKSGNNPANIPKPHESIIESEEPEESQIPDEDLPF